MVKLYRISLLFIIALYIGILDLEAQTKHSLHNEIDTNEYAATYQAITTTAFTPPKGSLNYQNLFFGINTLEYGVSDNFSLSSGVGISDINLNDGVSFFLFGKYKLFHEDNTAFSISSLNILGSHDLFSDYLFSVLYLHGSFGNYNNFVSFGAGASLGPDNVGIITFGYHNRISKSTAFIIDIWLALLDPGSNGGVLPLPTIGFRSFLDNNIIIDFGFPYIGCKIPFVQNSKSSKHKF